MYLFKPSIVRVCSPLFPNQEPLIRDREDEEPSVFFVQVKTLTFMLLKFNYFTFKIKKNTTKTLFNQKLHRCAEL